MSIYFSWGTKPATPPPGETDQCASCAQIGVQSRQAAGSPVFDTDRDLKNVWLMFWPMTLAQFGQSAWDRGWTDFVCKNDACKVKEACSNRPDYIEVGSYVVPGGVPGGTDGFQLYVTIVRQIRCVSAGSGKDVPPRFPNPRNAPAPPEPGQPEPPENDPHWFNPKLSYIRQDGLQLARFGKPKFGAAG